MHIEVWCARFYIYEELSENKEHFNVILKNMFIKFYVIFSRFLTIVEFIIPSFNSTMIYL